MPEVITSYPPSEMYRQGWDRIFGGLKAKPVLCECFGKARTVTYGGGGLAFCSECGGAVIFSVPPWLLS